MTKNWSNKLKLSLALALVLALAVTIVALADNVQNDVATTAEGKIVTITAGDTTGAQVGYRIAANSGDGQLGCNASDGTAVTVTPTGLPTGVTKSPSSLTFAVCSTAYQFITFSADISVAPGDYSIDASASDSGSGSYNTNPAEFTLRVLAPPEPEDDEAPTADPTQDPVVNANGWNNTDVTVDWNWTDTGSSGIDEDNCEMATVATEEGEYNVTATCFDLSGNEGTASYSIKIDKTKPVISGNRTPAANSFGWNNTDVTVSFSCAEVGSIQSGVDVNTVAGATVSTEGAGQSVINTGICTDKAGNSADSATVSDINIDKTKPTIVAAAMTAPNAAGWYNSDVTVQFTCSDALSGIPDGACPADQVLSIEGAAVASTAQTVTDAAGNTSDSSNVVSVMIDKTAPTASASASPGPNANGWNNTDVTVSFSGTDGLSGIDFCAAAVVLSSEGAGQSASGTCTDKAGNESAPATTSGINIDKTAPTASASASPAPNANDWNNTDVTVSFSGDDGTGSGIDFCSDPVVLSSEGAGQSASGTCTDKAGNASAPATASGINIDKTAPTVSLVGGPADGGSYYFGFVPAAPTCSASDALSGLDGGCSVSGYSTALGSHTVTASATDKAGNTASASHSYTVLAWTLNGFYAPVDMGGVFNVVKGGSTVPLKFEIFAGVELTDISVITSLNAALVPCTGGSEDAIETVSTGGTSLRYDWISGQFIFNWQTPKKPGNCYAVTMTTQDGSYLKAFFKLK